jgi:hypothetical protein
LGPGFIHSQGALSNFLAIPFLDGFLGLFVRRHFDESKALRATAVTINDESG